MRASADFASHTETEFAWRAGLGINYQPHVDSPLKIGAVVRYSDLGDAQTGDSETYPTVESLTLPITNIELALQLGYYF
jgi:opacity protein-like surface antigen